MTRGCRFCSKKAMGHFGREASLWDRVILESSSFVAVPTLGAIVEGWVLLVPKMHYLCIGAMDNHLFPELHEFQKLVCRMVQDCYGPVAVFEHGPARPRQAIGCGVDHAHLHVLPTACDLVSGVREISNEPLEWQSVQGIQDTKAFYSAGLPYLYVEQPTGRSRLTTHPNIQSQLFRRVVAAYEGRAHRYDWQAYPDEHNIRSSIGAFETWLSRNREMSFQPGQGVL
jgi:diadenosine tetraphosphate (Ap4A) HIT family hydrolase